MDSYKFHDVKVEKANAIAKYGKIQRITSLFRFVELLIFLIVVSRFSTQFASSLRHFVEHIRGVSVAGLISPKSVFVVGNAIVIALFLISGQFSGNKGEKGADFYDEYVEKCRNNQPKWGELAAERASDARERKAISRTQSSNLERLPGLSGEERRSDLRRSMSEKCRKNSSSGCGMKAGGHAAEEMSGEEFRRTVEAFIARQQRSLREEESFSAVVSFQA